MKDLNQNEQTSMFPKIIDVPNFFEETWMSVTPNPSALKDRYCIIK